MARTSRSPKMRLGELLVAAGLVSDEKVRMGLEEQRRNNLFLGEALVQLGFVSEEAIAQAIIQHFNLPFLSASQFTIPPDVFNLFPERMYNEYQFIAVDKIERVIIIIAAGPINQDMMEELERVSECRICHYVSTWRDIHAAIQRNSKELGGEAQVELTGLGSMLLEVPNLSKTGTSITQKLKKLDNSPSQNAAASRPIVSRPNMPASTKAVNSANLSALLSPLAVSSKATGMAQVSPSTPPSPRLTAFLKVPAPSNPTISTPSVARGGTSAGLPSVHSAASSAGLAAISLSASSAGMPAIRGGGSSPNLSAVTNLSAFSKMPAFKASSSGTSPAVPSMNGSSAGLPAVKKDNPEKPDGEKPPKRMSSFLQIRKS